MLLWAPDQDLTKPGIISADIFGRNSYGLMPTARGYKAFRVPKLYGGPGASWPAWTGQATAMYGHHYGGVGRIIVGTYGYLYELSTNNAGTFTTTNVTHGAGSYGAKPEDAYQDDESNPYPWAFTSFGAYCLASAKHVPTIQIQTAKGGLFSDITGSPPCSALTTFRNFVIAGNVGTYGAVTGTSDMVAWSGIGDHTTWTPDAATQAGYQQLTDVPGRIVALKPLGDAVAVYKKNAIWLMRYAGPPSTFSFQLVSNRLGASCGYSARPQIIDIGGAHIFVGNNDIYIFNGTSVRSLTEDVCGNYLRSNFFDSVYSRMTEGYASHDMRNNVIYFWTYGMAYNYRLNKWGPMGQDAFGHRFGPSGATTVCECAVQNIGGAATGGVLNDVPMMFAGNDRQVYCPYIYNGGGVRSADGTTITYDQMALTLFLGRNDAATTIKRIVPRFAKNPTAMDFEHSISSNMAGTYTAQEASVSGMGRYGVDEANKRIDILSSAYWHRVWLKFPTDAMNVDTIRCEIIDVEFDVEIAGKRTEGGLGPFPA